MFSFLKAIWGKREKLRLSKIKQTEEKFKIFNAYCTRIILTLFIRIYIGVIINESKKSVDKVLKVSKNKHW